MFSITQRHPIPEVIESTIPMPTKYIDGRSHPPKQHDKPNPWDEFLGTLSVGDSFVVPNHTVQYVQNRARRLKFDIVTARAAEQFKTRIWLYGVPGNRTPIIDKRKVQCPVCGKWQVEEQLRS